MDTAMAVGHVHVVKRDKITDEVVYDKWFKNQITNFARNQMALMWAGVMGMTPSQIAVGTGISTGTSPNDTALWSELAGTRQNVDYATTFLSYYTQYSVTYDQTEALGGSIANYNDPLTEYQDSTANGWTTNGSVTFAANGATIGSTNSTITSTIASAMDPDTVAPISAQATFKIASASPSSDYIHLVQDASNFYEVYLNTNILKIAKTVNGVHTVLVQSSAVTLTSGASYTITVSMTTAGLITAKIYSGATATGTALATLTFTDTALPGPYALLLGGDTNTVITNAIASYSNPTQEVNLTEAGLFDDMGNLWSHVQLNGVVHDNSTTLSIQWQVFQQAN